MRILQKALPSRYQSYRMVTILVLVVGCMPAMAEKLYISRQATYVNPERVRVEVRKDCEPDLRLPVVMQEEISNRTAIQSFVLTDHPAIQTDGLAMTVAILGLEIPHGAGFSTEKRTLTVKTVLYRNGTMVAEFDRFSEVRGSLNFIQKVFRIRKACDYAEHLFRDVSRNTVERFKLMKLLPETAPKTH